MDERDRHRALADGGGYALDRAVPNVAGDEDARLARLDEEGVALERPPAAGPAFFEQVGPGHQEAALVAAQPSFDARGERLAADQDEECVGGKLLFVLAGVVGDDDGLESILPTGGDHA